LLSMAVFFRDKRSFIELAANLPIKLADPAVRVPQSRRLGPADWRCGEQANMVGPGQTGPQGEQMVVDGWEYPGPRFSRQCQSYSRCADNEARVSGPMGPTRECFQGPIPCYSGRSHRQIKPTLWPSSWFADGVRQFSLEVGRQCRPSATMIERPAFAEVAFRPRRIVSPDRRKVS
jgi:hypothetical protein